MDFQLLLPFFFESAKRSKRFVGQGRQMEMNRSAPDHPIKKRRREISSVDGKYASMKFINKICLTHTQQRARTRALFHQQQPSCKSWTPKIDVRNIHINIAYMIASLLILMSINLSISPPFCPYYTRLMLDIMMLLCVCDRAVEVKGTQPAAARATRSRKL